jgi:anti-sigma-K factor RskA
MQYSDEAISRIAGEYVLGLAPRPLARAVRRRLHRDAVLAAEVARWEHAFHTLGDAAAAPSGPSERTWQRIAGELPALAPVAAAPSLAPPAPQVVASAPGGRPGPSAVAEVRRWWQNLWLWQGWAVAASAAVVFMSLQDQVPPSPGAMDAPAPSVLAGAPTVPAPSMSAGSDGAAPAPAAPDAAPAAGAETGAAVAGTAVAAAEPSQVRQQDPARVEVAAVSPPASASPSQTVRQTAPLAEGTGEPTVLSVDDGSAVAAASSRPARGGTRGATGGDTSVMMGMLAATGAGNGAAFVVVRDPRSGTLRVRATSAQSAGEGRDFELWAVPKEGPPRSLGLVSGTSDTLLALDTRLDRSVLGAQVLAISVEPKGGSPTGGPTGEVRFAGPMQAI